MTTLPRLAYLTALYPAASHTFILREVEALRDLGFEVETFSMRRPLAEHLIGPEEKAAFETTFYLIENGRKPAVMLAALVSALASPGRFFKAIALAWTSAPPGLKGGVKQAAYFAEALILSRSMSDKGIDHLHNHFADPSANVAMLASALSGIPFSYTLHGPAELYEPEKWQLRRKSERAAFVACISHFARSQAMYFSEPEHWHKMKIIHCGVRPDRYESAHQSREDTTVELVFVGRLTPIKGVRLLLEAFAAARVEIPGLRLKLVGDGDDRAHLEEIAAALGDAVSFVGYLSQAGVAEALSQADILVLPSFAEGLPVVLMEALAARTPVIATQVAGVSELVEDGVSGFVVPPGDVATLTDRIIRLAKDPDLRTKMGAAGRRRVEEDFDVRKEAARIGALFTGQFGEDPRPLSLEAQPCAD